jgi:hypothetical protein
MTDIDDNPVTNLAVWDGVYTRDYYRGLVRIEISARTARQDMASGWDYFVMTFLDNGKLDFDALHFGGWSGRSPSEEQSDVDKEGMGWFDGHIS